MSKRFWARFNDGPGRMLRDSETAAARSRIATLGPDCKTYRDESGDLVVLRPNAVGEDEEVLRFHGNGFVADREGEEGATSIYLHTANAPIPLEVRDRQPRPTVHKSRDMQRLKDRSPILQMQARNEALRARLWGAK